MCIVWLGCGVFFFKQKTAYEMRISDWSSDVCSSDLLAGVSVSAGSACSSGKVAASHVLRAMGVGEAACRSAIRVSLGWSTTAAEVDRFIAAWTQDRKSVV